MIEAMDELRRADFTEAQCRAVLTVAERFQPAYALRTDAKLDRLADAVTALTHEVREGHRSLSEQIRDTNVAVRDLAGVVRELAVRTGRVEGELGIVRRIAWWTMTSVATAAATVIVGVIVALWRGASIVL